MPQILESLRNGDIISVRQWLNTNESIDKTFGVDICNSALMIAAWNGQLEVVNELIQQGADVRFRNTEGSCVLQFAARHSSVLKSLLNTDAKFDVNYQDKQGFNALMQAVNINEGVIFPEFKNTLIGDRLLCIETLVEHGADVNQINKFGRSVLMSAAYTNSVRLVSTLMKHGARVDFVCSKGRRAIDYSCEPEIKRLLQTPKLSLVR